MSQNNNNNELEDYIFDEDFEDDEIEVWGFEDTEEDEEYDENDEIENNSTPINNKYEEYDNEEYDDSDETDTEYYSYEEDDDENEYEYEDDEETDEYEYEDENDEEYEYNDDEYEYEYDTDEYGNEINDEDNSDYPFAFEDEDDEELDNNDEEYSFENITEEENIEDFEPEYNSSNSQYDEDRETKHEKDNANNENKLNKIKKSIEKPNLDNALEPYDKLSESIIGILAKIPVIGTFAQTFTENPKKQRTFIPTIFIILLVIIFLLSTIMSPKSTSKISLPDNGEVTIKAKEYNENEGKLKITIKNTGDVSVSANGNLTLYTYNPISPNPKRWVKYKPIGSCVFEDLDIGYPKDDPIETTIPCTLSEGEKTKWKTTAQYIPQDNGIEK